MQMLTTATEPRPLLRHHGLMENEDLDVGQMLDMLLRLVVHTKLPMIWFAALSDGACMRMGW